MFERITYISNNGCTIKLNDNANVTTDLMNMHIVFEDSVKKVLGEVIDVDAYTGGFNLQIAFSTGYLVGKSV